MVSLADEVVGDNERLSPVEQLEIYRRQFWLRHTGALVEDFPGLGGLLGQKAWERLVEEYLVMHPPTSFTLRDLGQKLPDFVAMRAGWLDNQKLAADMARLEWAYVEVFDAPESPRLSPDALARVDEGGWQTTGLVLSSAFRLLEVDYPVAELRRRLRTEPERPLDIPEPEPGYLAVYRSELTVYHRSLSPEVHQLLSALSHGSSLLQACEAACAPRADSAERVARGVQGWFSDFARRGWISAIRRA